MTAPDPRGFPRHSAMARLDEEPSLFPSTPHWSFDHEADRANRRRNALLNHKSANDQWARKFKILTSL